MAKTLGGQEYTIREVDGALAVVHVGSGRVVFHIGITGVEIDLISGRVARGSASFVLCDPPALSPVKNHVDVEGRVRHKKRQ